jgi:hypothetical protein
MPGTEMRDALAANAAFYAAMRAGDLAGMDALWTRARMAICTHPNQPTLFGRRAVMESWRMILTLFRPPRIRALAPHAVVTGGTALVLCRERVGAVELMASNSFAIEDGAWRIVTHQAMPVED